MFIIVRLFNCCQSSGYEMASHSNFYFELSRLVNEAREKLYYKDILKPSDFCMLLFQAFFFLTFENLSRYM